MNESSQRSAVRRLLSASVGAAALAAGLLVATPSVSGATSPSIAAGPIAATTAAAGEYRITGKVTVAGKKTRLGGKGSIVVYTNSCRALPKYAASWNSGRYTIKVAKPGRYRLVYSVASGKYRGAWYGAKGSSCKKATPVLVKAGSSAKKNLVAKARGLVQASGVSVGSPLGEASVEGNYYPILRFYDAQSGKYVKTASSTDAKLAPGTYKVARWVWSDTKNKRVVANVFGTKSKKISQGKKIKVIANRALGLNFKSSHASQLKEFPGSHSVSISGTPKVGNTLTAAISGTFPSGTKLSTQWWQYIQGMDYDHFGPLDGKTSKQLLVESKYAGNRLSAYVTAKKSGYVTRSWSTAIQVPLIPMNVTTPQSVSGLVNGEAVAGQPLTAVAAKVQGINGEFNWIQYSWLDGQTLLAEGIQGNATFTPGAELVGKTITLKGVYWSEHYKETTLTTTFTVAAAP